MTDTDDVPTDGQFRELIDDALAYVRDNVYQPPETFWHSFARWCDDLGYSDQHQRLGMYAVVLAVRDGKIVTRKETA